MIDEIRQMLLIIDLYTMGIRIPDKSGFQMVKTCRDVKWLVFKLSIQKPDRSGPVFRW